MPPFRSPPAEPVHSVRGAAPPPAVATEDLRSPEDLVERRRRRRRLIALMAAVPILGTVGFGARPALHLAKAWQSRRTAAEAERLIEQQRWLDAKTKVQDAIALWPLEPAGWTAAAHLLSHTGNVREAASAWKKVEAARPLTGDEQREDAHALLAAGDPVSAEQHLRRAWRAGQTGNPADWELAMEIAARREMRPEALSLARQLLATPGSTPRERFNAALVLVTVGDPPTQTDGWAEISRLSAGQAEGESLDALVLLAQHSLSGRGAKTGSQSAALPSPSEIIERIEHHPRASIAQRLLAIELRIAQDRDQRDRLIQSAVDQFAGTKNDADLATLARWLYTQGDFKRVLDVVSPTRATDDRALFFQRLDALAALGRWGDIRQAIESHQVAIDPVVEQMYLARCAGELGEPRVRDARWAAALDAAGTDPDKLVQLGVYAGKTGNSEVAQAALRNAIQAAPDSRAAYEALLGTFESAGKTRDARAVLTALAMHWPKDTAIRNDVAYLDALLGENVPAALKTAQDLVRAEPSSLPHRVTLALAEFRSGNNLAALDAFSGIDLSSAPLQARQRAVMAAVLWATSYDKAARDAVRNTSLEQLLPEERALVQPILNGDKQGARSPVSAVQKRWCGIARRGPEV